MLPLAAGDAPMLPLLPPRRSAPPLPFPWAAPPSAAGDRCSALGCACSVSAGGRAVWPVAISTRRLGCCAALRRCELPTRPAVLAFAGRAAKAPAGAGPDSGICSARAFQQPRKSDVRCFRQHLRTVTRRPRQCCCRNVASRRLVPACQRIPGRMWCVRATLCHGGRWISCSKLQHASDQCFRRSRAPAQSQACINATLLCIAILYLAVSLRSLGRVAGVVVCQGQGFVRHKGLSHFWGLLLSPPTKSPRALACPCATSKIESSAFHTAFGSAASRRRRCQPRAGFQRVSVGSGRSAPPAGQTPVNRQTRRRAAAVARECRI